MKILFCDPVKVGDLGTQSVHIYEVLSNLSKMGHTIVTIHTGHPRSEADIDARSHSLWTRVKSSLLRWRIFQPFIGVILVLWYFLREIPILVSAASIIVRQRGRFDVIYRRNTVLNSEYLLAKLFRIPSVKEVNGIVADDIKMTRRIDNVSWRIINRIERFNMPRADKIIVVTSKLQELLQRDYGVPGDKIVVIPNGANTDLFRPMHVTEVRGRLGLCQNHSYVCFVGELLPWQGVEYLVRSMPFILKQYPETRFLIVGDGQLKQELIELAEQVSVCDKLIFTGMVPYQKVPLYINSSDVCVAPFIRERNEQMGVSPLKLCEYMACGKPVVTSRLSGLEIVEENGAGILVEADNAPELAIAITALLRNQELGKQMGENGRKYVVQNRSWESVARKVAAVCQSLVDNGRHQGEE